MASKRLSKFANYCAARDIGVNWVGSDGDTLFFDVYTPRHGFTLRKRQNFERRLHEDNPGWKCNIKYLTATEPPQRRE